MKLEVSVELNLKVEELTKAVKEAARLAMRDTVVDVANDAIQGSPFLTGNNRRSIMYEVGPGGEVAKEELSGAVYSTSGYGGWLEVGHGAKPNPRPYFKPALDLNFTQEKYAERVKRHLKP